MYICARLCSYVYNVFLCVPPVWDSALRWLCPSVWPAPAASAPPIPLSWGNNESTNQNHSINLLPVTHRIRWSNGFTYPITLISLNCCFQDHIKLAPNKRQWTETGREILNCSVRNFFVFLLQNSLLHCALINKTLKVQNDPIEIHVCQIALCYISICKAVNVPPHCINNLDLLWFANHLAVDTTWRHINRAVESGSNSTADYHFMQNISRHEG